MTEVERLGRFVVGADFADLSPEAVARLKVHILDTLGVAIGALDGAPILLIRQQVDQFGGNPLVTLIGGGKTAPDRAAFYNGALVRYFDFMDSYLAPDETFHPSDNLSAVLAASEYADATGKEFLAALAIAYEVQARLSEAAPVRPRGFDHTTQGAYAAAAGVAKALRLDAMKTANAIAISGTANNALRVTRTGTLSHWKGLAYPNAAFSATHSTFLAMHGITGPLEVFEGNKGFKQSVAGPFVISWEDKSLDRVKNAIIKKYNAEIHSQSAIEGALELKARFGFKPSEIEAIDVETFVVAYNIIGGGQEGPKKSVRTKEQADHSLPYMIAVALIDNELYPEQYTPLRIVADDVQALLQIVHVRPNPSLTKRFPSEMPSKVTITLHDGSRYAVEKSDYEGFTTRPMSWDAVARKFQMLAHRFAQPPLLEALVYGVKNLETIRIRELAALLLSVTNAKMLRKAG